MARTLARRDGKKALGVSEAKEAVLSHLANGLTREKAMQLVGRSLETYRDWMKKDPEFKAQVERLRQIAAEGKAAPSPVPGFEEFSEKYLNQKLGTHHLRMLDVIERRAPRDLHPSMTYLKGWPERVCFNVPPEHGKSTVFAVNYIVWRVHRDPNVKIVVMSQTLRMAKKFLSAIKFKLTSPVYQEMHARFAPDGGWKDPDQSWTSTEIYVQGKGDGEKDPTVQALSVGGQIYGARCDLIVMDDVTDFKTAGRWPWLLDFIAQDVSSRLPREEDGLLIINGTRVAPEDLYSHIKNDDQTFDGERVWTYLAQPAVLEKGDTYDTDVTLWPERWNGRALAKRKAEMRDERRWQFQFQQADVSAEAVFPPGAVHCSVDRRRLPGILKAGALGHPEYGMRGMYVTAGVDPAGETGHAAMVILATDRLTQKRWVLDAWNVKGPTPLQFETAMKDFTRRYGVREWIVEKNGFQSYFVRDERLKAWLYQHGSQMKPHFTSGNKYDPDMGVPSMVPLFLSCGEPPPSTDGGQWRRTPDTSLIGLPNPEKCPEVATLISELCTWEPVGTNVNRKNKQDLTMALWFAEIGAAKWLGVYGANDVKFLNTGHASKWDMDRRMTVDLNELAQQQLEAAM